MLLTARGERTTLHGLVPLLSCQSCQPTPPFAMLVKLSKYEWESANKPAYIPIHHLLGALALGLLLLTRLTL